MAFLGGAFNPFGGLIIATCWTWINSGKLCSQLKIFDKPDVAQSSLEGKITLGSTLGVKLCVHCEESLKVLFWWILMWLLSLVKNVWLQWLHLQPSGWNFKALMHHGHFCWVISPQRSLPLLLPSQHPCSQASRFPHGSFLNRASPHFSRFKMGFFATTADQHFVRFLLLIDQSAESRTDREDAVHL